MTTRECTGNHLVLYDVSWDAYTQLLDALGNQRLRHSYDDGVLEMMSPLKEHERAKRLMGRMIESMSMELDLPIQSVGSTTLRRDKARKGLEPDECYYISHEKEVRDKIDYDPKRDPPPDLAIEVDVTHSSVSRMDIYAALGIPEVWRATAEGVYIFELRKPGARYVKIARSKALPLLTPKVIDRFLAMRTSKNETALIREFTDWVRSEINKRNK